MDQSEVLGFRESGCSFVPLIGQLFSPSDLQEQLISAAVFLAVSVIWIASMMRRSQNEHLRKTIFIMGILVTGWILVRTVRRQVDIETTFARYLWYSYYIFEILLPLTVIRTASLIGVGPENRHIPKWFMVISAINIIMIVLVLTNDLHGMMINMDLASPGWSLKENYGYSMLYYVVAVILFFEWIGGAVLSFIKVKGSPRRAGVILLLILILAIMAYKAGYGIRIPIFVETDLTMVTCTFTLLFFELCMRLGQIPVNNHYRKLFERTGHGIQITDDSGVPVFVSGNTEPIAADLWEKIRRVPEPIYKDENTILFSNKITGGYAVWQEDVTVVNKLRRQLEETNKEIELANQTLFNIVHTKEQAAQVKARTEFYAALEKDTADDERRLEEMLRNIPDDAPQRAVFMGIAALLVCNIKRQSQLLIFEMSGNKTLDSNDFIIYLDELSEYAGLAGVQCLISCNIQIKLSTRCVMVFYSFFHDLLAWLAQSSLERIILHITDEGERVVMKLLMSQEGVNYTPPVKITKDTTAIGGIIEKEELGDMASIRLSFPVRGESDD